MASFSTCPTSSRERRILDLGNFLLKTNKVSYACSAYCLFSCCCTACKENWPLLDDLPTFTQEQLESRLDWAMKRIELEDAAQQFDVERTKTICESLSRLADVKSPHDAFVVPEMYLQFSNLLLNNSRSLRFSLWATKHMKPK